MKNDYNQCSHFQQENMGILRIESEFKRTTDRIPTLEEWLEDFFKVTKYIKK